MRKALRRYLVEHYQRHVLGESVKIEMLASADPGLVNEIEAELARIDAIGLGANLAQRDFDSYQSRIALQELLVVVKQTGTMKATEKTTDRANFHH